MKLTLNEDWKAILSKAWTIKFNLLAAALGFGEVLVQGLAPAGIPDGLFVGLATIVSTLTPLARVLAQQELTHAKDPNAK